MFMLSVVGWCGVFVCLYVGVGRVSGLVDLFCGVR